jgi:hypothetical protein
MMNKHKVLPDYYYHDDDEREGGDGNVDAERGLRGKLLVLLVVLPYFVLMMTSIKTLKVKTTCLSFFSTCLL